MTDCFLSEDGASTCRKPMVNQRRHDSIPKEPRGNAQIKEKRIKGEAEALNIKPLRLLHQNRKNCGMKVQVEVAIDVIHGEAGPQKFIELRSDFLPQLLA